MKLLSKNHLNDVPNCSCNKVHVHYEHHSVHTVSTTMPDVTPNTDTLCVCATCRGFNARQEVQKVTTLLNEVYRTANR